MKVEMIFTQKRPGQMEFRTSKAEHSGGSIMHNASTYDVYFSDSFKGFHFLQTGQPNPSFSETTFQTLEQAQEYVTAKYQEILDTII